MGGALVISTPDIPNTLNVRIIRDETRINSEIAAMVSTVATLTTSVAQREAQVAGAQVELDSAKVTLQLAVDNEEPREIIVGFQEDVIVATSNLVNAKTDLSVAKYKLLSAEKRLATLNAAKTANQEVIAIFMADSGTSIVQGTVIGVAEIAREASLSSTFVALPSERPGHSVLYEETRDGNVLPKIAERPYGWWYNTMVEPSAQIWQPRYWSAVLIFKDDDLNTGKIATIASTNFNTRPDSDIFFLDVPFEYETTNSLTFQVGDTVLVEFDSNRDPTIIGFASTGEKPEVFGIARYDYLGSNLNDSRYFFLQLQLPAVLPTETEDVRLLNFKGSQSEATSLALTAANNVSAPNGFSQNAGPVFTEHRFKTQLNALDPSHISGSQVEKLITSGGSAFGPIIGTVGGKSEGLNVVGNGFSKYRGTGFNPSALTISQEGVGHAESAYQGIKQVHPSVSSSSTSGSIFLGESGLPPTPENTATTYAKMSAWDDWTYTIGGIDMPTDWLFDNSNYVTPPEDNQFMTITRIEKLNPGSDFLFRKISLWKSFGPPSKDYVCNPIATNGTQNLLEWSERLDSTLPEQAENGADLQEGVLKAPDCVSDGAGVIRMLQTTGFVCQFFNKSVGLVDAQDYVFSAFVRRDSYMFIQFGVQNEALTQFDLKAGIEIPGSRSAGVNDAGIIAHDGEWFRVWVTFTNSGTNGEDLQLRILDRPALYSNSTPLAGIFASNGLNGVAIWGMQVHTGIVPATYVKTTGSIVP